MKNIKVTFQNKETLITQINGSVEEIEEYYLNNYFNPSSNENAELTKGEKVEVLK
jgi:hypothetical protein